MLRTRLINLCVIISICFMPSLGMAASKVAKLKEPVKSLSEYEELVEEIFLEGDSSVAELISILRIQTRSSDETTVKRDHFAKVTAMNLLGELKAKNSLSILNEMLERSENQSIISNAGRTIGSIGGDQAYKILSQILKKSLTKQYSMNEARQRAAIIGLGLCGNQKAVSLLLEILKNTDNSELIKIYSAGSLGLLGNNEGLDIASKGLDSEDSKIKLSSIMALGLIGSLSSVDSLTYLTQPWFDYVYKSAATLALAQIESAQMPEDQKIDFIADQLEKYPKSTEFIQWGTKTLVKMNTPVARKRLERLSEKKEPQFEVLSRAARLRAKCIKE